MKKCALLLVAIPVLVGLAACSDMGSGKEVSVPDLKDYALLKTQRADAIPQVPGEESTLAVYGKGLDTIMTFQLDDGKVYAFIRRNAATNEEKMYVDDNNDGKFTLQDKPVINITGYRDPNAKPAAQPAQHAQPAQPAQ